MSPLNLTGCLHAAPIQQRSEVYRQQGQSLVRSDIHHRKEGGFLFFPCASVREPSGDRLVTQRPWVSTREYGGWNCTGERRGSGDKPEMVKKKQRDASCVKCVDSFSLCCVLWVGPRLEKTRLQFIEGLKSPALFPVSSRWSKFVFFMMHREGWAKQMKPRTVHIIGRYFLPPMCTFFRTLAVLGCSSGCQCVWPAWGNFYNEIHLGAASLCALP